MCLDLLAEEHGVDVIPGPRRAGRDGGVDGIYEGRIGRHTGRWKIACAVRQNVRQLESKIDEERSAAKKRGLDSLLVMTPLDLNAPALRRLREHAGRKLKHAIVWAQRDVERLLRMHPWIASQHFGHELLPGFVPLQTAQIAEIIAQPDMPLVGRDAV